MGLGSSNKIPVPPLGVTCGVGRSKPPQPKEEHLRGFDENGKEIRCPVMAMQRFSLATALLFDESETMLGNDDLVEDIRQPAGLGTGLIHLKTAYSQEVTPLLLPQPPTMGERPTNAQRRPMPPGPVPAGMGDAVATRMTRTGSIPRSGEWIERTPYEMAPASGPCGACSVAGSLAGSRAPSSCGVIHEPVPSQGNSRAASPARYRSNSPALSRVSAENKELTMGSKELAVLKMLRQGIDIIGDHMCTRINRRLDEAHDRLHVLETRVSTVCCPQGSKSSSIPRGQLAQLQIRRGPHQGLEEKERINRKQMQVQLHHGLEVSVLNTAELDETQNQRSPQSNPQEHPQPATHISRNSWNRQATTLPVVCSVAQATAASMPPAASAKVWGGALVELQLEADDSKEHICTVTVSVSASWHDVRQKILLAVHACTRRTVDAVRFADGNGSTIGLNSSSSWFALCLPISVPSFVCMSACIFRVNMSTTHACMCTCVSACVHVCIYDCILQPPSMY